MTKLEIKLKYHEIISHADKATRQQIVDCQSAIESESDAERNAVIDALNKDQQIIKAFSDGMAAEAFLVLGAYGDRNHPAHDFAVAYVEAVRSRIDCLEGKA